MGMNLQPFLELGKQITGSLVCEIDLTDANYQWILAENAASFQGITRDGTISGDSSRNTGIHEIEDLSKDNRYKDLAYVKGTPYLRYYFGIELTTPDGLEIGTMSVSDTIAKRISKAQKVQFKLLAHAVMMAIESENSHHHLSVQLQSLKKNLHRLNHDVRSPLNGITGLADLIIDEQTEDNNEISVRVKDIEMIKKSAQSIVDIFNGALSSGKHTEHGATIKEKTSVSDMIKTIEGLFDPLALKKNVTLLFNCKPEKRLELPYSFSIKLLRIVGNLVSNAIKFSPKDGTVLVMFSADQDYNPPILNVTVENSGKSMSPDQMRSFVTGDVVIRENRQWEEKSFGLGLQHVYQMVSEEGGSLGVEKGEVDGTTFKVSLSIPKTGNDHGMAPVTSVDIKYPKPTQNGQK
jgi:signal transduction histidine kinase